MPTEKRQRQKEGRQIRQAEIQRWEQRRRYRRYAVILVVIVALVFGVPLVLNAISGDDSESASSATTTTLNAITGPTECPPAGGVDEPVRQFAEPPPDCLDPDKQYQAVVETSEGTIRVDLDTENTPDTVNNFVVLARYGYYDDTTIFRTNTDLDIIQGGGVDQSASPGYSIPDEGDGYTYEPGQLVMARTAEPDSAGGQWFIVGGPGAASLDVQGTYVVFGTTDDAGLEVVQSILDLHQSSGGEPSEGAPSRPVTVESVRIRETPAGAEGQGQG